MDSLQIDREHIWHPFTSFSDTTPPILIREARGLYLHTQDGRKIMDAVSSWWVNIHGHSHPAIAKAIFEQASSLEHVIFAGFTHEPAIRLTKNLLSVLPRNQSKIFFSDNGSTAVEVAIKMALQFHFNKGAPRRKIIAFEGAYHGDTFGSMSVGGRSTFTAPFNDLLFDVESIPVPSQENADVVINQFKSLCKGGDVAAFIYEPLVQGAAGMVMYDPKYLDTLLSVAKTTGTICVADEVFTGFGRTGKWFASFYMAQEPDIIAVSKGITGGTLPLGVTACSEAIAEGFYSDNPSHTFFHGHSYTANPIACAAANASFQLLSNPDTWKNIQEIEFSHRRFVARLTNDKRIRDVRSLGTILAIEIETGENTSYFNSLKKRIYSFFLDRNILLRPLGNVIYVLPPYIAQAEDLETIYSCIEEFLTTLGDP